MIRLAFLIHSNKTWIGGINVILNLINLISNTENLKKRIKIILITDSRKKISKFKINEKVEIIENSEFFDQNIFFKILDKLSLILLGKTIFLEKLLIKYKLNYISHTNIATGNKSFTKSIVWIPDFQFLYFPQFFSFTYRIIKKINILIYKNHAYKILLSSKTSAKDLNKICKIKKQNLVINSFIFDVPSLKKIKKKEYLKKKYNLNDKFFYVPNQYWIHKNHKIVIKALNHIKKNSKKQIIVYSSGDRKDYRYKDNFKNLMNLVKKNKLNDNYIYLGLIPFIDVMSLIYYSTAVINPSLFEGWSSSVEQAKAYNKKIILSDISVHREQKPKNSFFFKPKDFLYLSNILIKLNSSNQILSKKINLDLKKNKNKYTYNYCKIIN